MVFLCSKTEMLSAAGTDKPAYPRYSIGGCIVSPISCSSGLKPFPSGNSAFDNMKGFDVISIIAIRDSTTKDCIHSAVFVMCLLKLVLVEKIKLMKLNAHTRSSIEPS